MTGAPLVFLKSTRRRALSSHPACSNGVFAPVQSHVLVQQIQKTMVKIMARLWKIHGKSQPILPDKEPHFSPTPWYLNLQVPNRANIQSCEPFWLQSIFGPSSSEVSSTSPSGRPKTSPRSIGSIGSISFSWILKRIRSMIPHDFWTFWPWRFHLSWQLQDHPRLIQGSLGFPNTTRIRSITVVELSRGLWNSVLIGTTHGPQSSEILSFYIFQKTEGNGDQNMMKVT